jgi:hypothetical protein
MGSELEGTPRPSYQVIAEHCAVILAYGTHEEKLKVRKYLDKVKRIKRRAAIEEKRQISP